MISPVVSDGAIRPSASRMLKFVVPACAAIVLLLLLIGIRTASFGLTAPSSVVILIGVALFTLILGGFLVLFFRNSRFFVAHGQIGMRDYLGRTQVWPVADIAQARFQKIDYGAGPIPALLLVSPEHRLLVKLSLLSWNPADIERVLTGSGLSVAEAPPLSKSAFLQEFPTANPSWSNKQWKQWVGGAILALVLGVGGVAFVLLVDR
jgi:hypothetical protein